MGKLLKLRKLRKGDDYYGFPYQEELVDDYSSVVYRYTPEVQKAIGCSTKSEPWLHVVFFQAYKFEPSFNRSFPYGMVALIFVWDTREVVGYITLQHGYKPQQHQALLDCAKPAVDNGTMLKNYPESIGHGATAIHVDNRLKQIFHK